MESCAKNRNQFKIQHIGQLKEAIVLLDVFLFLKKEWCPIPVIVGLAYINNVGFIVVAISSPAANTTIDTTTCFSRGTELNPQ